MKLIFTLLSFSFIGTLRAQFDAIVSRIRVEPVQKITVRPIYCGFAYNKMTFVDMPPSFPDIPSVRRSLEGLQLPVRVPVHPRPLDTAKQNPLKVNQLMPCRIRIRCASTISSTEPLLVVDGILIDSLSYLNKINPNDIEDITILKDAMAQAIYGCRAASGVIIVTTKKIYPLKIQILDKVNREPVPRASVRFVSFNKKDTIKVSANDSGILFFNRLKRDVNYDVLITSVGYQPQVRQIKWSPNRVESAEWMLDRNEILASEIIIPIINCWKSRKISYCHLGRTRGEKLQLSSITEKKETKAFPNPARPGQTITIEQDLDADEKISLRVFNAGGAIMGTWNIQAGKGRNQLRFTTGNHWPAGTYFFRVFYAKGGVAASGSIIIQ